MNNTKPMNEKSVNPEMSLQMVSNEKPKGVLIAYQREDLSIGIHWSSMPMEVVCFLKEFLNLAVEDHLKRNLTKDSK